MLVFDDQAVGERRVEKPVDINVLRDEIIVALVEFTPTQLEFLSRISGPSTYTGFDNPFKALGCL